MAKSLSSKSSIKMLMAKNEKLRLGAPKKITNLSNCIKNTPKNGHLSPLSWGIVMKISVFTDTEDFLNSESTEKSGLLRRTKPFER